MPAQWRFTWALAMVYFSEPFIGGFFGFGRTYGAVVRIECDSIHSIETDWPNALREAANWRSSRNDRATVLHLYLQVPQSMVSDAMSFVADRIMVARELLPEELRGLCLEVNIFTPEMEHHMHLVLYPDSKGAPQVLL